MRNIDIHFAALAAALLLSACSQQGAAPSPADDVASRAASTASPAAAPGVASPAPSPHAEACGDEHAAEACGAAADSCGDASANDDAQAAAPALRRVPADQVCMRSNRFLGKTQLSAEVDGRAYHGCCAGCTKHLGENAAARTAKDPVTGNAVDKATAVIGARPDGSVVYFESAETFARAGGA